MTSSIRTARTNTGHNVVSSPLRKLGDVGLAGGAWSKLGGESTIGTLFVGCWVLMTVFLWLDRSGIFLAEMFCPSSTPAASRLDGRASEKRQHGRDVAGNIRRLAAGHPVAVLDHRLVHPGAA